MDLSQQIVAGLIPGHDQVAAIEAWIRNNIHFNSDSIHYQLSAVGVNEQREGVCREHAHFVVAYLSQHE